MFFQLFNGHHFENGVYEVTYQLIFIDNIRICYKNIYHMLEHVCVALPYALRGKHYKSIMNRI